LFVAFFSFYILGYARQPEDNNDSGGLEEDISGHEDY
jgi:hypothetical protein